MASSSDRRRRARPVRTWQDRLSDGRSRQGHHLVQTRRRRRQDRKSKNRRPTRPRTSPRKRTRTRSDRPELLLIHLRGPSMFDIGFTELLVIGVVALIVVGPKDLPTLFRTLGRFTARMRALGREFTSAMNDAADESGMKDVAKDLKGMTSPRVLRARQAQRGGRQVRQVVADQPGAKTASRKKPGRRRSRARRRCREDPRRHRGERREAREPPARPRGGREGGAAKPARRTQDRRQVSPAKAKRAQASPGAAQEARRRRPARPQRRKPRRPKPAKAAAAKPAPAKQPHQDDA